MPSDDLAMAAPEPRTGAGVEPSDSLHAYFERSLTLDLSEPAIETDGVWHLRETLRDIATQIDRLLTAAGVGAGTGVALVTRNRLAHVGAVLGLLATQRCVVVLSGGQPPAKLAADIAALRPAAVLADAVDWGDAVTAAALAAGAVGIALFHRREAAAQWVPQLECGDGSSHPRPQPGTAIEMQTSGTTGKPKRIPIAASTVLLAVANALRWGARSRESIAPRPYINYYPIGHLSGFHYLLLAWCERRPLVLMDRFDLDALRAAVRRHRPDTLALPPAVLRMVLDANVPPEELSSVEVVRSGTAPLDPELQHRFEATYGTPILVSYGATEFWVVLSTWTLADHRQFSSVKPGSVGRAAPHVHLRIADPLSGASLPTGQVGLLEARIEGIDLDWTRTTDLARIDADGFVFLSGRTDDAINRGGFKVSAGKVAGVLRACPGVADAAVAGVADARLGQIPVAVVELRESSTTLEAIEEFARDGLASYEVPARIVVVPALPRTPALKVDMAAVRALFEPA